jgi:hypothetical protein
VACCHDGGAINVILYLWLNGFEFYLDPFRNKERLSAIGQVGRAIEIIINNLEKVLYTSADVQSMGLIAAMVAP